MEYSNEDVIWLVCRNKKIVHTKYTLHLNRIAYFILLLVPFANRLFSSVTLSRMRYRSMHYVYVNNRKLYCTIVNCNIWPFNCFVANGNMLSARVGI